MSIALTIVRAAMLVPLMMFAFVPAHSGSIGGIVRNASGGTLLSGMTVAAYSTTGILAATATTDAVGRYRLVLPDATFRVVAWDNAGAFAPSYYRDASSYETSLPVNAATNPANVDFDLQRAARVNGVVMSDAGARLSGITVAIYNLDGTRRGFASTDAAGTFLLFVPAGQYKLAAYDDMQRYVSRFYDSKPVFSLATTLTATAGETITLAFQLAASSRIEGLVSDRALGVPLAGMSVVSYTNDGQLEAAATSDANGRYVLLVPSGAHRLVAFDPAGQFASAFAGDASSFERSATISTTAGGTANAGFQLERAGHLRGQVLSVSGMPVSGITVAAYNPDGTRRTATTTNAAGEYLLVLPAGEYRVGAYDESLLWLTRFHTSESSFHSGVVRRVIAQQNQSGVDIITERGGRFEGVVRSTASMLAEMTIAAFDETRQRIASTRSDAAGRFRLLVPAGVYRVAAYDEEGRYVTQFHAGALAFDSASPTPISAGGVVALEFQLRAGATVAGRVVSRSSGAPVANARIDFYTPAGQLAQSASTASDGSYLIAIPEGAYKVVASDPAGRFGRAFFEDATSFESASIIMFSAGGVRSVDFRLEPVAATRRRSSRR